MICFVTTAHLLSGMLDEYTYHYDKDDNVKEQDGKDRAQVGTKQHTSVANEAAGGKKSESNGQV